MTSMFSMLKVSRVCEPASRAPSTKMLAPESKPRMNGRSPSGLPPSPAPKVMPGVVRRASCNVTEPDCWITSAGTMVTDFGVSSSGAVNFGDSA
ncbi:hypothetical protein D3C87_1125520 [compost metagenome]